MPTKTPSSIDAVTIALRRLLESSMPKGGKVTTLPPSEAKKFTGGRRAPGRLNLFLFRLSRNTAVRNPLKPVSVPGERPAAPEMPVDLHFLLTAHGTGPAGTEHSPNRLIELAVRALTNSPILPPAALPAGGSAASAGQAEVIVEELTLEEMTRLWEALRTELQVSVALVVRNVVL